MATKRGNAKNKTIKGTNAKDSLFGLGGNDKLDGGTGNDRLAGGDFINLVNLSGRGSWSVVELAGDTVFKFVDNFVLVSQATVVGVTGLVNDADYRFSFA